MKKIGIIYGQDNLFSNAIAERINAKDDPEVHADFLQIDKVIQGRSLGFTVIIDLISQYVPFYRAFLKNEAFTGTAVMNNPFWWSADDQFFNNALAEKIGVTVPKTVILPSKQQPPATVADSFRNMKYPLNWDAIFNYVGFPAYLKPFAHGDDNQIYRVANIEQFFKAYDETGQSVMMLQEEIPGAEYYRCYVINRKDAFVFRPNKHHSGQLILVSDGSEADESLIGKIKESTIAMTQALGYDLYMAEFMVKNNAPYAVDVFNPVPEISLSLLGEENFNRLADAVAEMAMQRAKDSIPERNNCTWGEFIRVTTLCQPGS